MKASSWIVSLYMLRAVGALISPQRLPVGSILSSGTLKHESVSILQATASPSDRSNDHKATASYQLTVEYCTGCRWGLRSFWLGQELLSTFAKDPALSAVTLQPSRPSVNEAARFRISLSKVNQDNDPPLVIWDRKEQGGFPESKLLKQLVRDELNPDKFLGHSDTSKAQEEQKEQANQPEEVIDLSAEVPPPIDTTVVAKDLVASTPHIAITYCAGCQWMLRAAYFAQELMSTFPEEINSISLIPSRPPAKGGAFIVTLINSSDDGGDTTTSTTLWNRQEQGGFPEAKELKQKVRDLLNPLKDLGHVDGREAATESSINYMDDDEAEEARKFFGVM